MNMRSRYYSDNESKSDKAGLAAGAATTAGGGALLVHTLRKKGKKPVKEVVEVVEKVTPKKGGTAIVGKGRQHLGNWAGGGWMVEGTRDRVTRIGSKFARKFHSEIENENMEIRRKLFSVIEDENGEEKYYSTTEFSLLDKNDYGYDDEKLFSTGDSELDDLLEEVYYSGLEDGYDYAYEEREYAENEDKESSAGVAAAGAASAGGVYGIGKLRSKKVVSKAAKEARAKTAEAGKAAGAVKEAAVKEAGEVVKNVKDRLAGERISQSGVDRFVDKIAGKLNIQGSSKRVLKEAEAKAQGIREAGTKKAKDIVSNAVKESKGIKDAAAKKAQNIGKKSKIGAAAVLGTSGLIAAGKAIKNNKQPKNA